MDLERMVGFWRKMF